MDGFRAPLRTLVEVLAAKPQDCEPMARLCTGITTDTRTVQAGDLFVALTGERFDGHDFVAQAIAKGAIAAVVRAGALKPDTAIPRLEVNDTLVAYQALAQWWRQQRGLPVVAITGSVGKTTTKELVSAALSLFGTVLKTEANHNNEIGVPKTLLAIRASHDYAVVEMGMRGLEEIALLTQIAQPDVALMTNVGTAHIGRLGSREAIAQAKCELLRELPTAGIAVLNADDPLLMSTAAQVWTGKKITYGLNGGDVRGQVLYEPVAKDAPVNERLVKERLVKEELLIDDVRIPMPLPGRHNALNLLGAIATLQALNLDWRKLAQGFEVTMPAGRSQVHHLPHDITLLDETYNAGAEAMIAALQLLAAQPAARRIAVLGTMKELGAQSVALHRQIGQTVADLNLDALLILADPAEAEAMAEGAQGIISQQFTSHAALGDHLKEIIKSGDRILFKASRSVQMDKVVIQLLKDFSS
ncbi:MAG: UDP-N-acetylmuramoyl-tripeptide--D-alanyl-D-alanine ligase [Phormidesmis sp. RL_2_1]|nr:UDP-N-acetylmuramoyl-tripeptide--D-alanyl-D-alanine ligase [Phormidesmis sp. RL_2_1]